MNLPGNNETSGQNNTGSNVTTEKNLKSISKKYIKQIKSTSKKLEKAEILNYHLILEDVTHQKKLLKLKYTDISKKSNVPLSTVKRILYGVTFPKITTLLKVLDAMGLTLTITKK